MDCRIVGLMTSETRTVRPRSWQEMRKRDIELLIQRTGEGLDAWNQRVRESGVGDEASLRAWLTEQGVTGYPAMLLVMERFGYPDYLRRGPAVLFAGQYADRPRLRPFPPAVLASLPASGGVGVQAATTT